MRDTILVVDKVRLYRDMLEWILEDEYTVFKAECGEQALKLLREYRNEIAVVLLDANLSDSEGVDVIAEMRSHGMLHRIPVLAICDESESDSEKERKCLEVGVSDIIYRPFDSMLVRKRVHNIFHLFEYQNELEDKVKEQTKTLKAQNRELERQRHMLKKANDDIIGILGGVVEGRDAESGEHIRRVKGFTELLARQLMQFYPEYGLDEQDIEVIVSTSALHDVGKIAISDAILLKPGKLTAEEFELMKTHTVKGDAILNYLNGIWDEKWQKTAHNICRYHHERYDGRGYPDGLKGEEIPICAQIVSLADVYDALVSVRVYKRAYTKEEAFNMIMNGECGQFSPKILRSFSAVRPYFEELAESAQ